MFILVDYSDNYIDMFHEDKEDMSLNNEQRVAKLLANAYGDIYMTTGAEQVDATRIRLIDIEEHYVREYKVIAEYYLDLDKECLVKM